MSAKSGVFVLLLCGALAACKSAKVEFGTLLDVGGISLDDKSKAMAASSWVVTFSGKCSPRFTDVEWSADNGATWVSIKTTDPAATVNCSTSGTFGGTFDLTSYSAITTKISGKMSTNLKFRGISDFGISAVLALLLIPPPSGATPKIIAGFNTTTAGGYTLKSEVGGFKTTAMTAGYKLQGKIHYK
jgi:hypothetical protein